MERYSDVESPCMLNVSVTSLLDTFGLVVITRFPFSNLLSFSINSLSPAGTRRFSMNPFPIATFHVPHASWLLMYKSPNMVSNQILFISEILNLLRPFLRLFLLFQDALDLFIRLVGESKHLDGCIE